jgi:hypothetical protein
MKKFMKVMIALVVFGIIGFAYYYVALPAINIHSPGFWWFIMIVLFAATAAVGALYHLHKNVGKSDTKSVQSILFTILSVMTGMMFVVLIVGGILSSPFVNAKKYQKILKVTNRNYVDDIKEISYQDIPVLDKDSAILLGSRKMGSITEYVSQYEVSDNYSQINYKGTPVRVTPLKYGSIIKWFNNRSKGIPAYMKIDMSTQNVELVKLKEGMKYTESDHFGRNIYRYLRFHYPTYIFDTINFEIGDDGVPYWICPVKKYTIGLFGGQTIGRAVIVNAVTGDRKDYSVENIPTWVDKVYSADMLISFYDYYGTLKHGFWNSKFGQKDALQTTKGYNYLAMEDDVWVYTGVTSVGSDQSNVGFVLMNQRTAETRFYSVSGAEEFSAMASAEGQVQHLGYKSTFPLLLNVGGEPTYFMALKDAAGLVKKYAMVNIAKYQIVAIGDTVNGCEKTYLELMKSSGIKMTNATNFPKVSGTIKKISDCVVDGNTHYYILLNNSDKIFDVLVSDFVHIITYDVGDPITFSYTEGKDVCTVMGIEN